MYKDLKVSELRDIAKERGIEVPNGAKKAGIIELLEGAEEVEADVISEEIMPAFSVNYSVGTIDIDLSELKNRVIQFQGEYEDWNPDMFDKDDMSVVKSHRLYVSDQRKKFSDAVKSVKNAYSEPLVKFNEEVKEINELLDGAYRMFKDIEDELAEHIRQQNLEELEETYLAYAGVLADVLPFDKILDRKWLNKSFGMRKAEEELTAKVDKVLSDWNTLKSLELDNQSVVESHFFTTLDLNEAIAYAKKLEADEKKIEEIKQHVESAQEPLEPISRVTVQRIERGSKWLMMVDNATVEQCRQIGKFCGSLGVTGKFIQGDVPEEYIRSFISRNRRRETYGG